MNNINKKVLELTFFIPELLEKYGIEESDEEMLNKIEGEKKTNEAILAQILGKNIKKNFSLERLASMIKKELDISDTKAITTAKELKKITSSILKPEGEKIKKTEEDAYREKI